MRRVPVALILLLIAPLAVAKPLGDLEAETLRASGSVDLRATLAGFHAAPLPMLDGWTLDADNIRWTYETVEGNVYAPPAAVVRTDPQADIETGTWSGATARFSATGVGYILAIGSDASFEFEGSDVGVRALPHLERSEPEKDPDQQAAWAVRGSEILEVVGGGARATLAGSFGLAVYGARVDVAHDEGSATLPTGRHHGPSSLDGYGADDESWLYLAVDGGRLTLPAAEDALAFFVEPEGSTLQVDGSIELIGAEGAVAGQVVPAATDMSLVGTFEIGRLDVAGSKVGFTLEGDPHSLTIASQSVSLASDESPPWVWVAGTALVALAAALLWRRGRSVDRLHRDLAYGRYTRVLRSGQRWLGGRHDAAARIATACALVRTGRPQRALETIRGGTVAAGPRGMVEAHALSLLGRDPEARRVLARLVEHSPHLEAEVLRNPALARLRRGAGGGYA